MTDKRFSRELKCFSIGCNKVTTHRKRRLDIHYFWVCDVCSKTNWLGYKKKGCHNVTLIPFWEIANIHDQATERQLLKKDISKGKTISRHGWMKEYRTKGDD